jgi:hypothetical protein
LRAYMSAEISISRCSNSSERSPKSDFERIVSPSVECGRANRLQGTDSSSENQEEEASHGGHGGHGGNGEGRILALGKIIH